YVGSDRCAKCHEHAYQVWQKSKHSHAFETLVTKAKHPSLRQFDGECVKCHTVGFEHTSGFQAAAPAVNDKLKNVGCESCHGPASAHVKNTNNKEIRDLMNPLSTKRVPARKQINLSM